MKTPITYYGGKQTMLPYIRPLIPEHDIYCEPFAGGAAVFFDKEPTKINVINDLNSELINFYRVITLHPNEFKNEVLQTLHSRDQHKYASYIYHNPLYFTNIQRAWAVWCLSQQSFSGILTGGFSTNKKGSSKPQKIQNAKLVFCDELKELLEKTTIECDDAFKVIKRYDNIKSFFFLDPPYIDANMGHYSGMFDENDLKELLNICTNLEGKFLLTMYPNDLIKRYADENDWIIHIVNRQVSACDKDHRRKQDEWMICNYIKIDENEKI